MQLTFSHLLQANHKIRQSLRKEFLVEIGVLEHRAGNLVTRLQRQDGFDGTNGSKSNGVLMTGWMVSESLRMLSHSNLGREPLIWAVSSMARVAISNALPRIVCKRMPISLPLSSTAQSAKSSVESHL
jgi:hypothetical protein